MHKCRNVIYDFCVKLNIDRESILNILEAISEMTERKQGYIKSRFSPSNIHDWYNGSLESGVTIVNSVNNSINSVNNVDEEMDGPGINDPDSEESGSESEVSVDSDDELRKRTTPIGINNRKPRINTSNNNNNRSGDWRSLILRRYRRCVVTGLDTIECDAAHIVPFKQCQGNKKEWGTSKANGLLLSKNLHWTFDRYYWSLDPNDVLKDDENYAWLRIVVRNTKKRLSILDYFKPKSNKKEDSEDVESRMLEDDVYDNNTKSETYGYVRVFKDNIPFLKIHYESFLAVYNLQVAKATKELEKKKEGMKYNKACEEQLMLTLNNPPPTYRIMRRKFDNKLDTYLYMCTTTGHSFGNTRWLSEKEGLELYGTTFSEGIKSFNEKVEKKEDPDWIPQKSSI